MPLSNSERQRRFRARRTALLTDLSSANAVTISQLREALLERKLDFAIYLSDDIFICSAMSDCIAYFMEA